MPVIIDNQECIIQCISKINQKLKNIHFVNDLIDKITEISFKNYIGRISFGSDQSFHTIYSINPEFQTQYKCLWYYSAKDTIHYLGLYTPNKNKDTFTRDDETSPPSSPKTLTIPKEREDMDPEGSTLGYEDFQYMFASNKQVKLNRDHIIPFDTIMTFVNVLFDLEGFKYNDWFKTALQKYNFNKNKETEEFYKRAKENEVVKNKALEYQSTFLEKKIIQESDDNDKRAEIILKWFYEPYIIVKKIETENKGKKESEIEQIITELKDIKPDALAGIIRSQHSKLLTDCPTILPSSFFTGKDGKYIDVDSVLKRLDNRTLQPSDEFIIKKATGWMPGNVFRAPKPKSGEEGNKFDCTVASTGIPESILRDRYYKTYEQINLFLNDEPKPEYVDNAIKTLKAIALVKDIHPFIYDNWSYDDKYKIFHPIVIFNDKFDPAKVLTRATIVNKLNCTLK